MKFSFIILLALLSICTNAQNTKLLMQVNGLPVRDGKIYKFESSGCYSGGVEIMSETDSVFSVIDGFVKAVYNLNGEIFVMLVNKQNSLSYGLSKLKNVTLKKGDKISKGDFVGLIKPDDDDKLLLPFVIVNQKAVFLSEEKIVSFLKKINPSSCFPNEQPIVAR